MPISEGFLQIPSLDMCYWGEILVNASDSAQKDKPFSAPKKMTGAVKSAARAHMSAPKKVNSWLPKCPQYQFYFVPIGN